jgi:hypothetical protein
MKSSIERNVDFWYIIEITTIMTKFCPGSTSCADISIFLIYALLRTVAVIYGARTAISKKIYSRAKNILAMRCMKLFMLALLN